jgi:hypothetical protein
MYAPALWEKIFMLSRKRQRKYDKKNKVWKKITVSTENQHLQQQNLICIPSVSLGNAKLSVLVAYGTTCCLLCWRSPATYLSGLK